MSMVNEAAVRRAIEEVPLLSPNASLLLRITSDPEHDLAEVIGIVKCDSALTARVLRVVNSAAFGLLNPISSIERAVNYLGERMVVGIAIAESSAKIFLCPLEGYEGPQGALWRHDLFAAIASREVARFARNSLPVDLAFTGGLLHDIGKAVVSDFLKGTSSRAVADIEKGEIVDYLAAERELMGLDHTVVGFELARFWKLPAPLQTAILHHHHPSAAEKDLQPLTYAVHLGDILAMMNGCDTGSDGMRYHLDPGYGEHFTLSSETLEQILLAVQSEFLKVEASLGLTQEGSA